MRLPLGHSPYLAQVTLALGEQGLSALLTHSDQTAHLLVDSSSLSQPYDLVRLDWHPDQGWQCKPHWCPLGLAPEPNQVARWLVDLLHGTAEVSHTPTPLTEKACRSRDQALHTHTPPTWRTDPDPLTDPAWN